MALHQEFKIDPEQALAPALARLEEAGILREDNSNREEIKGFLMQAGPYAENLALAVIELRVIIKDNREDYKNFVNIQELNGFLVRHAEYAYVGAQMVNMFYEQEDACFKSWFMSEFLNKDFTKEIKAAITENAQYAAQLALTKIQLNSASELIQECLYDKYLFQHARYAFEIFQGMKRLENGGLLKNQDNIPQIKILLAQYKEHAYQFAKAITVLCDAKLLDPNSEFLTAKITQTLMQCPPKNVASFAYGIVDLCEVNIFDQEHIDFLLINKGEKAAYMGGCLGLLKKMDENNRKITGENKEELFNQDNKSRILKHVNDSGDIVPIMWNMDMKPLPLVLNQDNFNSILKHARKFNREILDVIFKGADQTVFETFLKEIDHQIELQRKPFLVCIKKADPTKGLGLFSKVDQTLLDKIFSFLPKPTPLKKHKP